MSLQNTISHLVQRRNIAITIILTLLFSSLIINSMKQASPVAIIEKRNYDKRNSFSILSANVGNLSLGCKDVLNKLCYKDVEERIRVRIKYLSPDIIALQEVLAPWQCKKLIENNKKKICSEDQLIPQVRRLVGEDYTIACNSRNQFECIAVKKDFGEILNCQDGEICNNARTAPEIKDCDNGFTISAVTVKKKRTDVLFDIVNFHPQSTSAACRAKMINSALYGTETTTPIIQESKVLLLGDFNLDPWRDNDESVILWKAFVENGWGNSKFEYHSGMIESHPPYFTSFLFYKPRTVDFIVSNFAKGVCVILGESPSTFRLDGGKGTDHRAIYGILSLR